jgi:paraquat-inducible protein B
MTSTAALANLEREIDSLLSLQVEAREELIRQAQGQDSLSNLDVVFARLGWDERRVAYEKQISNQIIIWRKAAGSNEDRQQAKDHLEKLRLETPAKRQKIEEKIAKLQSEIDTLHSELKGAERLVEGYEAAITNLRIHALPEMKSRFAKKLDEQTVSLRRQLTLATVRRDSINSLVEMPKVFSDLATLHNHQRLHCDAWQKEHGEPHPAMREHFTQTIGGGGIVDRKVDQAAWKEYVSEQASELPGLESEIEHLRAEIAVIEADVDACFVEQLFGDE